MGFLVAFEGIDGSGKGTQARRLAERLKGAGVRTELISFPRYGETFFGGLAGEFLNGRFGGLADVHPLLVSLLFAGDRFESRPLLKAALDANEVVVLDRYVASNIAHQAIKALPPERDSIRRSIEKLEYGIYQMPRPDLTFLLDLSSDHARNLIALKSKREYTQRAADLQESDADYLFRVREYYLELAAADPGWAIVRCDAPGAVRPVEQIGEEIWQIVVQRRQSFAAARESGG